MDNIYVLPERKKNSCRSTGTTGKARTWTLGIQPFNEFYSTIILVQNNSFPTSLFNKKEQSLQKTVTQLLGVSSPHGQYSANTVISALPRETQICKQMLKAKPIPCSIKQVIFLIVCFPLLFSFQILNFLLEVLKLPFRKVESGSTQCSYFCTFNRKQKLNPSITQLRRTEQKKTSVCFGRHGGEGEAIDFHCVVPDRQEERQDARDVVYFGCSFINSTPPGTTINNLYSIGRHSFHNHSHLLESCSWPPFSHHSSSPHLPPPQLVTSSLLTTRTP